MLLLTCGPRPTVPLLTYDPQSVRATEAREAKEARADKRRARQRARYEVQRNRHLAQRFVIQGRARDLWVATGVPHCTKCTMRIAHGQWHCAACGHVTDSDRCLEIYPTTERDLFLGRVS